MHSRRCAQSMPRSTPGGTGAPALPSAAAAGSPGPPPAPAGGRVGAGGGRDGDGAGMVFAWRRFSGWAAPGSPGSGGGARPLGVFQGPLLCKQHICSWTPHSPPRRNPGGTGAPAAGCRITSGMTSHDESGTEGPQPNVKCPRLPHPYLQLCLNGMMPNRKWKP